MFSSKREARHVRPPVVVTDPKNKGCVIVGKDSHYIVSHTYQMYNDDRQVVYEHTILTTDDSSSSYKNGIDIKKITQDILLCEVNSFTKNLGCLSVIFDKEILDDCSNILNDIRSQVLEDKRCVGIIDNNGNILIYTKDGMTEYTQDINYNITYD